MDLLSEKYAKAEEISQLKEKVKEYEKALEVYRRELNSVCKDYDDLNDSYDRIQGVYQNEHCDLIQAKAELEKVKEISKEKIEELEKEYKILRTLNASSAYDYDKLDKKYKQTLQENVELKAYKDVNEDFKTAWEELKAKNEQLKTKIFRLESKQTSMCEQNKELIEDNLSLSKENARLKEENEKLDKMTGIFSARLCKKYRTTLQEIKALAEGIFIEGDMSNTYRIVNDLNKIITKAEVE